MRWLLVPKQSLISTLYIFMTLVRGTLVVRGRRTVTAALRVVGSMTSPKKTHGVLALEFKSAHSLGDLLTQQLDEI
jgi:hypothetical protein